MSVADGNAEFASVLERATRQLSIVLGPEEASQVLVGCLSTLPEATVRTGADLISLADCLITHGGFVEVVGRSMLALGIRRSAAVLSAR